uniref:Peroxiredoxin n=1 Tax=Candidatus Kentrum sp. MB TaxID=2138164 RepID=A0A450XII1_9GAMM|nr:MAG: Peroxiredoxin [Candidatus Kentron sp. MB]VFK74676.1 MAG: Peroxiredoxin [Candidatus Kentron sp. MB]
MLVSSTMLEPGASAPDFSLPDSGANGNLVSAKDFQEAPGLLVIFLCNHCPYVHHIRTALTEFAREYQPKGLAIVAINANDAANYPEDSPDKMAAEVANFGYTFPYLFDATQEVAKAYRAACTPDFFLFDKAHKLVYRGQFDDSRPKNDLPVTGKDLRAATDALLSGKAIDPDQKASLGCNIKWKSGNEPDYFRMS